MKAASYDFIVLGGGVVGLTVAREIALRLSRNILLLEKEPGLGRHASGRNSGVLHAGIYYAADSLKAKYCMNGARRMKAYALERGIRCLETGKVIVAPREDLLPQLDALYERAQSNGVRIRKLDLHELSEVEPLARTAGRALYSPETAVIDSHGVLCELEKELAGLGVTIRTSCRAVRVRAREAWVETPLGTFGYGHLVNAAGTYADEIAHAMGAGLDYAILPFKGLYRKLVPDSPVRLKTLVYPVPDLGMPFLGVHFTLTPEGRVLVGPTATPALGRENYGWFDHLSWRDSLAIGTALGKMLLGDQNHLRRLMRAEFGKYHSRGFVKLAGELVPSLRAEDLSPGYAKVGIRAQLIRKRTREFVMDFVVEAGERSTHILNAVSPAFTSSFAFAQDVVQGIASRLA